MNNKELEFLELKNITKEDKKVFLALGADYGNVGDIALTIAQEKILQEAFPDRKIIEIPMIKAYEYTDHINEILNEDDIFTIIGGGNMGNLYLGFEERRRFLIETFSNNKIISFPQSIDFLNTNDGIDEFKKSIEIYANNSNLTIFAREEKSYNIMKDNFKNNVYLVPDSAFYLKDKLSLDSNISRDYITLCLRNDAEKITKQNISECIVNHLNNNGITNIVVTDTHLGRDGIKPSERYPLLISMLNKFKNSKVVITDRLHGMIFSIITNTPCIVFDNSNKKISSTYQTWLKDIPFVKFLDSYDKEKVLEYVKELSSLEYSTSANLEKHFELLFNSLTNN